MAQPTPVLLDTDVFSYLFADDPGERATPYWKHAAGRIAAVSFITVGEALFGAHKRGWEKPRMDKLRKNLSSVIVIPFDYAVCEAFAVTKASLQRDGIRIEDSDLWIAACAIRHSIPLISNNRRHFERIPGLTLITEAP